MADKWQEIKLRLDADLAQSLRDLKRGHDESLSEVVLRLLRKAVRQSPAARGMLDERSGPRGARAARGGRNASGGARGGKTVGGARGGKTVGGARGGKTSAREARGGARGFAKGKPFAAREATEGDTWAPPEDGFEPKRAPSRPRAARPFASKSQPFRSQQDGGGGKPPARGFPRGGRSRDDAGAFGGNAAEGGQRGRMPRGRKVKGRRPGRG